MKQRERKKDGSIVEKKLKAKVPIKTKRVPRGSRQEEKAKTSSRASVK